MHKTLLSSEGRPWQPCATAAYSKVPGSPAPVGWAGQLPAVNAVHGCLPMPSARRAPQQCRRDQSCVCVRHRRAGVHGLPVCGARSSCADGRTVFVSKRPRASWPDRCLMGNWYRLMCHARAQVFAWPPAMARPRCSRALGMPLFRGTTTIYGSAECLHKHCESTAPLLVRCCA